MISNFSEYLKYGSDIVVSDGPNSVVINNPFTDEFVVIVENRKDSIFLYSMALYGPNDDPYNKYNSGKLIHKDVELYEIHNYIRVWINSAETEKIKKKLRGPAYIMLEDSLFENLYSKLYPNTVEIPYTLATKTIDDQDVILFRDVSK